MMSLTPWPPYPKAVCPRYALEKKAGLDVVEKGHVLDPVVNGSPTEGGL
jgi:hypothetical protein